MAEHERKEYSVDVQRKDSFTATAVSQMTRCFIIYKKKNFKSCRVTALSRYFLGSSIINSNAITFIKTRQ